MFFYLQDDLAPQVEGKGGSSAAEDGDETDLPNLDGFFRDVAAVIVRWYELVSHARGTYRLFKFL